MCLKSLVYKSRSTTTTKNDDCFNIISSFLALILVSHFTLTKYFSAISKCNIEQLDCLFKYYLCDKFDIKNLVHNEDCIKKKKITCWKKIFVTHVANNRIIGIYKRKLLQNNRDENYSRENIKKKCTKKHK